MAIVRRTKARDETAAGTPASPAPRARIRPEARARNDSLYEPYDGPPLPPPVRDEATGQLHPGQRSIVERVDLLEAADQRDVAEELLLTTLHQFILAKTPIDAICQRMQISFGTYKWLREKLRRQIRDQIKARDPYDYIAPMIAEMEEIKATAWREAAMAPPKDWSRRMRSMEIVMKANADIARMLQVGGLFDNSPMRAPLADDDMDSGGANVLKQLAATFLQGGYAQNHTSVRPGDVIVDGD